MFNKLKKLFGREKEVIILARDEEGKLQSLGVAPRSPAHLKLIEETMEKEKEPDAKYMKTQKTEVSTQKEPSKDIKFSSDDVNLAYEVTQTNKIPTINSSNGIPTKKEPKLQEKRYILPKTRRRYEDIDQVILQLLRMSPVSLSTSQIADQIRTNPSSCKSHLERLHFDGFIEKHYSGKNQKWCYWRLKR